MLLKKPARTMTTLHEDANVEEAEQEEVGKVSEAADKCQAASRLQPKEHHLEQHATVSDYKIIYSVWRVREFFFSAS